MMFICIRLLPPFLTLLLENGDSVKSLALPHMVRRLGNGATISLLFDRWIEGAVDTLIRTVPEGILSPFLYSWQVSDLVEDGYWDLKHHSLQSVWRQITHQQVPDRPGEDQWYWDCADSGAFAFSSAWTPVRERDPAFQLSSMIWY